MYVGDVGGQQRGDHPSAARLAGRGQPGLELSSPGDNDQAVGGCTAGTPRAAGLPVRPSGADVVIGGYAVRDPALPGLRRALPLRAASPADCTSSARAPPAPDQTVGVGVSIDSVSGLGEDGAGHLYATSLNGPVVRLTQNGAALGATRRSATSSSRWRGGGDPGDANRLLVAEKAGGHIRNRDGSDFLDLTSLVRQQRLRGGSLERRRGSPTTPPAAASSPSTTTTAGNLQVDQFTPRRRRPRPLQPEHSPRGADDPALGRPTTTTAASSCSGPTATCTYPPGTAAHRAIPRATLRSLGSLLGKILRRRCGRRSAATPVAPPVATG